MNFKTSQIGIDLHPGEFIRQEFLQNGGQSIFDFAMNMGISEKFACEIIVGIQPITTTLADKLANVYGIPSHHWLEMQTLYDSKKE